MDRRSHPEALTGFPGKPPALRGVPSLEKERYDELPGALRECSPALGLLGYATASSSFLGMILVTLIFPAVFSASAKSYSI